jgi:hypothetical protein
MGFEDYRRRKCGFKNLVLQTLRSATAGSFERNNRAGCMQNNVLRRRSKEEFTRLGSFSGTDIYFICFFDFSKFDQIFAGSFRAEQQMGLIAEPFFPEQISDLFLGLFGTYL